MGVYFSALTIVIALFFVRGEAGYLIAVAGLCYVVFDLVCAYGESRQKKLHDEMRELAKKLCRDEDETAEGAGDDLDENDDIELDDASELSDNGDELLEEDCGDEFSEDDDTAADIEAADDTEIGPEAETIANEEIPDEELSDEEIANRERAREADALVTPAMRAKYKGLEGKELEQAIAKDKVHSMIAGFGSSENKTA